jgi:hypothetical protein
MNIVEQKVPYPRFIVGGKLRHKDTIELQATVVKYMPPSWNTKAGAPYIMVYYTRVPPSMFGGIFLIHMNGVSLESEWLKL